MLRTSHFLSRDHDVRRKKSDFGVRPIAVVLATLLLALAGSLHAATLTLTGTTLTYSESAANEQITVFYDTGTSRYIFTNSTQFFTSVPAGFNGVGTTMSTGPDTGIDAISAMAQIVYLQSYNDPVTVLQGTATLKGPDVPCTWTLTGIGTGTLQRDSGGPAVNFTSLNQLQGGADADKFIVGVNSGINSIIGGNSGPSALNTIQGPALSNSQVNWSVSGADTGNLASAGGFVSTFSQIQNLAGGAVTGINGTNSYFFSNSGTLGGTVGGAATNELVNLSSTSNLIVNLQTRQILNTAPATIANLSSTVNSFQVSGSTTMVGPDVATVFNIGTASSTIGTVTVTGARRFTGGAGNDTFNIQSGVSVDALDGGAGSDILVGAGGTNQSQTWNLFTPGSGSTIGVFSITAFSNIENLTGGAFSVSPGHNLFQFQSSGRLAGKLTSGGALDTVSYSGYSGAITLNLQTSLAIDNSSNQVAQLVGTFAGIAGNSGTLVGPDTANTWVVTGAGPFAFTLNGNAYSSFNTLNGGSGNDMFTLLANNFNPTINGGGGVDTLVGPGTGQTTNVTFRVSNPGQGSVVYNSTTSTTFSQIENLTGGAMPSPNFTTFQFQNSGAIITGTVTPGTTRDVLDVSGHFSSATVNLATLQATNTSTTAVIANLASPMNLQGSGATLIGANTTNAWSFTFAGAGTLTGISFNGFSNFIGGSGDDTFTMTNLNASINNIQGRGGNDTIVGPPLTSRAGTFNITGANAGNYSSGGPDLITSFSEIENVQSGSPAGTTVFNFTTGSLSGNVIGASPNDQLNIANVGAGSTVNFQTNVASLSATRITGFSSISNIVGNASTFIGANSPNTWTFSPTNVTVNTVTCSGISNAVGGTSTDLFLLSTLVLSSLDGGAGNDTVVGPGGTPSGGNGFFDLLISTSNQATVTAIDGTSLTIQNVENFTGGALTAPLYTNFRFASSGSVSGTLSGGTPLDVLQVGGLSIPATVNLGTAQVLNGSSVRVAGFANFSNIQGGNSVIVGPDTANDWQLTQQNQGTVNGLNISGFKTWIGGSGNDTFTLGLNGNLANFGGLPNAALDGGSGGTDTLVGTSTSINFFTQNFSISGANSGNAGVTVVPFQNIDVLQGGVLSGTNSQNTFTIANPNSRMGNIVGVNSSDVLTDTLHINGTFNLQTGELRDSTSVLIAGFTSVKNLVGNSSTLVGANVNNSWTINANSGGTVGNVAFSSFTTLRGGTADDTFNMAANGVINVLDGGLGNNTLAGQPGTGNATFTITGQNAGQYTTSPSTSQVSAFSNIAFLNCAALTGTGFSQVVFPLNGSRLVAGAAPGLVTAGTARDVLDVHFFNASVNIQTGLIQNLSTSQAAGNETGFINFFGNGGSASTLIGADTPNSWLLTASGAGNLNFGTFTGFPTLRGGLSDDAFTLSDGAFMTLDGGGGNDSIAGQATSGVTAQFSISGTNQGTFTSSTGAAFAFQNFRTLQGGATGASGQTVFSLASSTAFMNTIVAGTSRDSLSYAYAGTATVDLSAGTATNVGSFSGIFTFNNSGGSPANYTLRLTNAQNTASITAANTGNVGAVTFTGFGRLVGGTSNDAFAFGASGALSSVDGGSGGTDTLNLIAPGVGALTNLAAGTFHGQKGNLGATVSSFDNIDTLLPSADLRIQIAVNPTANFIAGQTATFTLTLSNLSNTGTTGVTVTNAVPPGFQLLNSSCSQGTYTGSTWTVGAMAALATETCTLTTQARIAGPYSSTATITGNGSFDSVLSNNSSTVSGTIAPGTNSMLAFVQQPQSALAGDTLAPNITVNLLDAFGNIANDSASQVTLAFANNPTGATLLGTATVTANAGLATFSGLSIQRAGTGFTLATSSSGAASTNSNAFNITPNAAHHLVINQQPANTVAGATLASVQASVVDLYGNIASGVFPISLAINTNPGGGTLGGTLTVNGSNAPASFTTLNINKTGVGYTLRASSGLLIVADSNPFNITPGAPVALAFAQPPTNTTAGLILAPAVTVQILDANGNICTGNTSSINLAFSSNPAGATLGGSAGLPAINGVATFSTLVITRAGNGFTLGATGAGTLPATSASFNIIPAAANRLVFGQQPSNTVAGSAMAPAMTVRVLDAFDNICTGDSSTIALALSVNPTGAQLGGTFSTNALAGVATFNGLAIGKVGAGYVLNASGASAAAIDSTSFNITPAPAHHLAFAVPPSNAVAGVTIAPPVRVEVRDAFENIATAESNALTVSLIPNGLTLNGTKMLNASAGVATFSNLSINTAGIGYTLQASYGALTALTSPTFNITHAAADHLAVVQNPALTTAGDVIAPAPQFALTDPFGNRCVTQMATVSIDLSTNPGGASLSGATSVASVNGLASFTSLIIVKPGAGYVLRGTAMGLAPAMTTSFDIVNAPASALVSTVVATPNSVPANGTGMSTITVTVRDTFGNPLSGKNIALNGTGSAQLSPASGPTDAQGVTTFTATDSIAENVTFSATDTTESVAILNTAKVQFTPLSATVTLSNLMSVYDATPHAATATTVPSGLTVAVTYIGSPTVPTAAGSYLVTATVVSAQYSGQVSGTLQIARATPVVTWADPAAISTLTPLSATQLNAGADVPGTFDYTPTAGTRLGVGTAQTLSVFFTPFDTNNYDSVIQIASIDVFNPGPTITVQPVATPNPAIQSNPVSFNATAVAAIDGALTYTWDFEDGTPTATGQSVTHAYAAAGSFTATVTAADTLNATISAQVLVTVSHPAPVITTQPSVSPNPALPAATVTLQAAATSEVNGGVTYAWDFGDGNSGTGAISRNTAMPQNIGVYTAALLVTDTLGLSSTANITVNVENPGPQIVSQPIALPNPVVEGQPMVLSVTASASVPGALTYAWDFGDGSAAGSGPSVSHIYGAVATYTATVTITDGLGKSVTATVQITTVEAPLPPPGNGIEVPFTVSNAQGIPDEMFPAAIDAGLYYVPTVLNPLQTILSVRLNFAETGKDSIILSGRLLRRSGFTALDKHVVVDVGGVIASFKLNAAGSDLAVRAHTFKLTVGRGTSGLAPFSMHLTGDFAALLADNGLTNETVSNRQVKIPVAILIDSNMYVLEYLPILPWPRGEVGAVELFCARPASKFSTPMRTMAGTTRPAKSSGRCCRHRKDNICDRSAVTRCAAKFNPCAPDRRPDVPRPSDMTACWLMNDGQQRPRLKRGEKYSKPRSWRVALVPSDTPGEVEALQWIFNTYTTAASAAKEIARQLNNRGIRSPSGKDWAISTLREILRNPLYKGWLCFGRRTEGKFHRLQNGAVATAESPVAGVVKKAEEEWIIDKRPALALVSDETWETANRRLAERGDRVRRARARPLAYPLGGLVYCSECGAAMVGMNRDKKYEIYICSTHFAETETAAVIQSGRKRCCASRAT